MIFLGIAIGCIIGFFVACIGEVARDKAAIESHIIKLGNEYYHLKKFGDDK